MWKIFQKSVPDKSANEFLAEHKIDPAYAADEFVRLMKIGLQPALLSGIADDLFQPGREVELQGRVVNIVDDRLVKDKVPIGRQLRLRLIESILTDIAVAKKERLGESHST